MRETLCRLKGVSLLPSERRPITAALARGFAQPLSTAFTRNNGEKRDGTRERGKEDLLPVRES